MKKDYEIAQDNTMDNIDIIAKKAKISIDCVEYVGKYKAKINLEQFQHIEQAPNGKLILVTAINPTKAGEGKTTTTVGLVDGLASLNKDVIGALREPSLGPVFGMKGGATGGGYAQVVPMDDINLHFNGDLHAITAANNLVSAIIDNHLFHVNTLNIDPEKISWKRCIDMNDRSLRQIEIGIGAKNGVERRDGFDISVASEIMAVFCLAKDYIDLKERISRIVVARDTQDKPVTIHHLGVTGAVCALLVNALKPNLVQTLEKSPILIHGGPFANIAHGCNSVIATTMALKLADYVVTEAGFGADLGAEKFFDIKCPSANIAPSAVVIVATVRALKLHGGQAYEMLSEENLAALEAGCPNLEKHCETIARTGVPSVVALNVFQSDTPAEIRFIQKWCEDRGIRFAVCEAFAKGGRGAQDLAKTVIELTNQESHFTPIIDPSLDIIEKIKGIAKHVYGARDVAFSEDALNQYEKLKEDGYDKLAVCIAKTQYSLSDNPKLLARPKDFTLHVKRLKLSAGAGFVVAITGTIMTMPGLPERPAALDIDIDRQGNISGIF